MNMKVTAATDTVEVIIAGLGPTGLVLAHMLGMRGHRVVVLEREPVFYGNARAVYTDDECMRIFQHIGAAEEVQAQMLLETPVQFARPDGTVMGQYMPTQRPFGWPVVNFFYQPYLETTLTRLLARYPNVEVRRGRELVDFQQDASGVTVTHQATRQFRFSDQSDLRSVADGDADLQALRGRYLVGADGGRSVVRTQLGIEMTGKNFPEPWLVVDLKLKEGVEALRHMPYFNFVVDPKLPVVSCVQPDGFHRFEFMLMPGMTKEWMEQPETIRMLLSKYVDPDQFEVRRKLVYTFNALIAKDWRVGCVLLAGDAAHMTPQFMGQGASSGVRDAYNLGWKLSAVLKSQCNDSLLDSYGRERHDHAKAMINVSVWLKDVVSMTNPAGCLLRDGLIKLALAIPAGKRWFQEGGFKPDPVYTRGQYLGLPRRRLGGPEGVLAPQPEVRRFDGSRTRLDELLGKEFAVVGLNVDPRSALSAESRAGLDRLGARYLTLYPYGGRPQGQIGVERATPAGLVEVEDFTGVMVRWFRKAGYRREAVAILRPDKFAFAVVKPAALDSAVAELCGQVCLQSAVTV
ncbi:bifunctional 3-(3-hydroxy-phenyl)propionate/3-hydroxycinnamic acid hydroxylase [Solimonas sp. K1W22B-7]|uniref:bifunctional 3-(3-hydroxy-phenyl)propionate/3-hydroxycinnamic acid hydroxylase MhpA n=1 Tax=Solimonas sp. K1W22B-7 TaxID=2303331 RepID=UPI000E336ACE|nr:bifunctional 3-(3-hydroxy-phenyl)propionate/3-hydroxycinnamic acid hydroxylase [Solimonas sp. K1W22B-7]AXQ27929.1 bifunctional 3-(3-hydroxy-phenyl)propionate/3-hydroxycinnamic acid hydroxylase [Solimonas sp. K1W22B-7]